MRTELSDVAEVCPHKSQLVVCTFSSHVSVLPPLYSFHSVDGDAKSSQLSLYIVSFANRTSPRQRSGIAVFGNSENVSMTSYQR